MGRLGTLLSCLCLFAATPGFAAERPILKPWSGPRALALTDTVVVGFLDASPDPNKVHAGGVWDFDTPSYADDIAGTDSAQFWTFPSSTIGVRAAARPRPRRGTPRPAPS